MDWEIANFLIDKPGELARVFHFEVLMGNPGFPKTQVMVVDGLVFKNGRIRFNREPQLREKMERNAISMDGLVDRLRKAMAKVTGKATMVLA